MRSPMRSTLCSTVCSDWWRCKRKLRYPKTVNRTTVLTTKYAASLAARPRCNLEYHAAWRSIDHALRENANSACGAGGRELSVKIAELGTCASGKMGRCFAANRNNANAPAIRLNVTIHSLHFGK